MGLRINTNIPSLQTQRNVSLATEETTKSYARLSSGQRITTAGDDAAGLAISQNLDATIRGMRQAQRNANDGISLVQTAEGGINEVSNILVRMRELGVQAASDTVGDTERGFINKEYESMKSEINRIAHVTNFNGTNLLSGEGKSLTFQVGTNDGEHNRIEFDPSRTDIRTETLGVDSVSLLSKENAGESLAKLDAAISKVNENRADLGATQNRLHSTSNSLGITHENLSEARSRIADTDVAQESSNLIKHNILQSAGISVLAQANSAPQSALKLL